MGDNAIVLSADTPADRLVEREPAPLTRFAIPTMTEIEVMFRLASHAAKSGLANTTNPDAAFMIMMAGRELGLNLMTSLRFIYNLNGKPTCSAQLMLAMIKKSGKLASISISSTDEVSQKKVATVSAKRTDGSEYTATFSLEEAQNAQLTNKDVWRKHLADMLIWRAVSRMARYLFPDVTAGMYTTEELADDGTYDPETGDFTPIVTVTKEEPPPLALSDGDSPSGANGTNGDSGKKVTKAHWTSVKSERERVAAVFKEFGYTKPEEISAEVPKIEPGITRLGESKTANSGAFIALMRKHYEKPAEPTADDVDVWDEAMELALNQWALDGIGIPADDYLKALELQSWRDTSGLEEAKRRILIVVRKNGTPVISRRVNYKREKRGPHLEFETVLGPVRAYGRSTTVAEKLGEWYTEYGLHAYDDEAYNDPIELDPPLKLGWTQNGKDPNLYLEADTLSVLDTDDNELDALLRGEVS